MKKWCLFWFSLGILVFLLIAWSRPETVETIAVEHEVPVPVVQFASIPEQAQVMEITMTAYSSTPDQTDPTPFITASGQRVHDGIIAVSRDLELRGLSFGTKLIVTDILGPGCGPKANELIGKVLEVQDRMHRRKSKQIDVWAPTKQDALNIGRCSVKVVALAKPATTLAAK